MSARLECRAAHAFASGFVLDVAFETETPVTALFGPSGSGKSTLLAILAGLVRAQRAEVSLGQRTFVSTARGQWLPPEARGIGLVSQDALLFPHLDVANNLRFGARRRGKTADFDRVVEILELGELLPRRTGVLSGGQRQRVALGRALLSGPELLLLDEPLTGLEEGLRDRILGYVERAVREWRVPTLFVSHDQVAVRRLAGRVIVLDAGRIVLEGETAETLDRAVLGASDGHGPVNLLYIVRLERRGGRLIGHVGDQLLHLPGEGAVGHDLPGELYVRFSASDVALARGEVHGLSMRNHVRGRIARVEVQSASERAFVAVAVGEQTLWAELTLDAVDELGLGSGVEVVCFVKTRAMSVLT